MTSWVHGGITRQGSLESDRYGLKPGMDNEPVNHVSFYDTLWLAN